MARNRMIKPEFWVDDKIARLTPMARLLFIGTWNFADDEGRMEHNADRIKAQVFPYESSLTAHALLTELTEAGLLIPYQVDGRDYLQVKNFKKHQRINKPSLTTIPAPIHVGVTEESCSTTDQKKSTTTTTTTTKRNQPLPSRATLAQLYEPLAPGNVGPKQRQWLEGLAEEYGEAEVRIVLREAAGMDDLKSPQAYVNTVLRKRKAERDKGNEPNDGLEPYEREMLREAKAGNNRAA